MKHYTTRVLQITNISFKNKGIKKQLKVVSGKAPQAKKLRDTLRLTKRASLCGSTESNWMRVRKLLRERKLKMELSTASSSADASTEDEYSHAPDLENELQTTQPEVQQPADNNEKRLTFVPIDYLPDFSRLVTAQHICQGSKPISIR